MYSYSYCPSEDKCVADKWNKFNAWCTDTWIPGYKLDIKKDCKAKFKEDTCPSFVSDKDISVGVLTEATLTLSAGEACKVMINGTLYIAHASFVGSGNSDDSEVGILYNGIGPGDIIEV